MTVEEFWGKYMKNGPKYVFEEACELFSNELPDYFLKEYDVDEVLLEVLGKQESAKNLENVLKFIHIIRTKQPGLYERVFQYFDDFLIDYYCFLEDGAPVREAFANFIENPKVAPSVFSILLKRILCYQHTEILEEAVEKDYPIVFDSNELVGNLESDLSFIHMQLELQKVFESGNKKNELQAFVEEMKDYCFELDDATSSAYEAALFEPMLDAKTVNDRFKSEKEMAYILIHSYFSRYMYAKGLPFYVSAYMVGVLADYYDQDNSSAKTLNEFFHVEKDSLGAFLEKLSFNPFVSNVSEMIATVWGAVHFYEFLLCHSYISQDVFDNFLEVSRNLKGWIMSGYLEDLWKSEFVHLWPKPDCIAEEEFVHEQQLFKKSLKLSYKAFKHQKKEISEELSKMGGLGDYVVAGADYTPNTKGDSLDEIFGASSSSSSPFSITPTMPYKREERKVGRNEPCPCGSGKKYKKCCG